ncbi:hypothetical protein JHK86_056072 [Glycine max]|nr:hypothetical protein JHK86_056072 [Glycine max]
MNTKRTILSPFTKEYRVFVILSGIRQLLFICISVLYCSYLKNCKPTLDICIDSRLAN